MKKDEKLMRYMLWAAGVLPVLWLAMAFAQNAQGSGLSGRLEALSVAMEAPFALVWTAECPRVCALFGLLYLAAAVAVEGTRPRLRPGVEHGSARWGDARELNARFAQRGMENVLLTRNVRLGLDGRRHRRNLNVLVIGGSGAGKTRFYAKPNLMQCNTSFVVTDPKGELLRDVGGLLRERGYRIRVLNLVEFSQSDRYNPLVYIRDEKDVLKLVTNLIRNTTPRTASSGDPFWEKSETALLEAILFYLLSEAPAEEQNFSMVMTMLEYADVREEDSGYQSPLDMLFAALERTQPGHIAVRQYKVYKQAAGKTAKSILISLAVRLAAFNLEQIRTLTAEDELDIGSLGEEKTALFAVIPDNDTSFNYLVGMLYTQIFQELYYRADHVHGGRLPVHVQFILDEFANVALPEDFERCLATMRSREISASIIIQNLAQIKALFKDTWETIPGNCDSLLYLGGNETTTHEYISKMLGKETIDTQSHGQSRGRNGSASTNTQQAGRELMTSDEVRLLDNADALLFIRGEHPVRDRKYDLLRHPNLAGTADGAGMPYVHKPEDTNPVEQYELIESEEEGENENESTETDPQGADRPAGQLPRGACRAGKGLWRAGCRAARLPGGEKEGGGDEGHQKGGLRPGHRHHAGRGHQGPGEAL